MGQHHRMGREEPLNSLVNDMRAAGPGAEARQSARRRGRRGIRKTTGIGLNGSADSRDGCCKGNQLDEAAYLLHLSLCCSNELFDYV